MASAAGAPAAPAPPAAVAVRHPAVQILQRCGMRHVPAVGDVHEYLSSGPGQCVAWGRRGVGGSMGHAHSGELPMLGYGPVLSCCLESVQCLVG